MAARRRASRQESDANTLVIVESPAKARTIERYLGDGYTVSSSIGHIRDLPASAAEVPKDLKGKSWATLAVDVDEGFRPVYIIPSDKKRVVSDLRRELKGAGQLLLATDEDREGEAIAWHLVEVLKPRASVRRLVFHEITRSAITEALAHTREIDQRLVQAQESRRVLDRLIGYLVSPRALEKSRQRTVGRPGADARAVADREARTRAHGLRFRGLLHPHRHARAGRRLQRNVRGPPPQPR